MAASSTAAMLNENKVTVLYPKKNMKVSSNSWKYLGFENEHNKVGDMAIFQLCESKLKYFGSTSNLRYHLKFLHRKVYNEMDAAEDQQPGMPTALSAVAPTPTISGKFYFIFTPRESLEFSDL